LIVYFDLMNGKCTKPRDIVPPAYRATFNWRMKIIKLEACWSRSNLKMYMDREGGYKFIDALDRESARDFTTHKLLKKTMRLAAWKQLLSRRKYTYDEKRWTYKEFWNIKGEINETA